MPGIFGFIESSNFNKKQNDGLLEKMAKFLSHYDYKRNYIFNHNEVNAGLMSFDDNCSNNFYYDKKNDLFLIFDGEMYDIDISLYNKEEVPKIILSLFCEYGIDFVNNINGSFNIFIYDFKIKTSYIVNDRFGHRHFYYFSDNEIFMFSPEIKGFLNYEKFDKSLDQQGLSDFFVYSYQFSDRTFFSKVKLLPPASILIKTIDGISLKKYWVPQYSNKNNVANLSDCIEEGYECFSQSVSRCLGAARKVLVPISGGLDSRLILSFASQRELDITPITFGTRNCSDFKFAKQVCSVLSMQEPQLIEISDIWYQEYADRLAWLGEAAYGALGMTTQYGVSEKVKGPFDRSLNGLYGGHLSFGSPYFNKTDLTFDYSTQERTNRIKKGFNGHRYPLLEKSLNEKIRQAIDEFSNKTIEEEWERSFQVSDIYAFRQDYIFIYNRIRRGMNNINQNKFFYNDRQPFASYELFDFYLSLSPELSLGHFLYKELYKKKLPRLARIPWQQTGLNLYQQPSSWFNFRNRIMKKGKWYLKKLTGGKIYLWDPAQYSNQDLAYQKNPFLQQWLEKILLSEQCLERGYYSKQGIIDLLSKQTAGENLSHEIDKLVMFELWNRKFIDLQGD